jgi:hypothetical protein
VRFLSEASNFPEQNTQFSRCAEAARRRSLISFVLGKEKTRMQLTFRPAITARVLTGLGAATGAIGVAAMMSTATAPSARADDFTDTIATVESEYADGQTAFSAALADFGSNHLTTGTALLFDGFDDDFLAAPNILAAGTVEGLTNETYDLSAANFDLSVPASFAAGLSNAESIFSEGQGFFSAAAADVSAGAYGDATYYDLFGMDFVSIVPLEEILLGSVASF